MATADQIEEILNRVQEGWVVAPRWVGMYASIFCAACRCPVEVIHDGGQNVTVACQKCDGSGCPRGDAIAALNRAGLDLVVRRV